MLSESRFVFFLFRDCIVCVLFRFDRLIPSAFQFAAFRWMRMKYVILVLVLAQFYSNVDPLDLKDVGKSTVDVVKGVVNKIPDVIPKPDDIFQGGKNLIAGYPFEQLFSAINSFCK